MRADDGGLQVLRLGDGAEWDAFLTRAPGSTFCHLLGWRELFGGLLRHECPYLVAVDGRGLWRGVLPLVRVKSPLLGHYLVSMPFLNYGGPLGTPAAQAALATQAQRLASESGADLLELRARAPLPTALRASHRKITVLLDLPEWPDALWGEFPAKLRSQIRRPQKEGMECRFGLDQREAFYDVFARNMRDLGTPVLPASLFDGVARVFPHVVIFGAVYRGAQPVAAGCGFLWRGEFEMTWASSLRDYGRSAANMLLYWAFMEHVIGRGARVFNFGRCTPGGGTHRFKQQWGGRDVRLPWLQWSRRNLAATPSPDRPVFRLAAALWRRLPLRVANRVGPLVARQLP